MNVAGSNASETPLFIGEYRVLRPLGRGKLGDVFLARDDRGGRMVALKLIAPSHEVHDSEWRRFRRAVDAVVGFRHEGVAELYAFTETELGHVLVMEFVQGPSLDQVLRKTSPDQAWVVCRARWLTDAVRAAHAHGIVHRALRTDKIVLRKEDRPVLLDLGLDDRLPIPDPRGDALVRAVQYRAPEQITGERVDKRTDFFSLGIILYEMITRQLPFSGPTAACIGERIRHKHHEPLAQFFPGVHAKLSVLVDWLLQKDPERRPESAVQIDEILRLVAADMPAEHAAADPVEPDLGVF